MYIKIHINVYIYIHNRHRVLFNTNVSTCHYFSRLPKSALGRDYALHPLPQGRDLGVSPCGGMGGEESLAGLPGDPVARRSTGSFHGDFHVFFWTLSGHDEALAMEKSAMYDLHCDLAKYGDFP